MHFQRLRLSGFKSFVDPTEFRIEPGLTGVVGPNGCGKSNLLEALRWVMGANSAKAMRGGGMDDVIFSGSAGRPARNHAEVTLTIDNAERKAPAPFTDQPTLEVVRRIDRGEGSTYRINGREVRARDVQLLFADASTGANSPALVRQGQISELISARPQNRRRILEEAAGVSGLHTRRHEAELRVRAAETNLTRLTDVMRELEGVVGRLRREARQAAAFRRLSAEIRALQSAVLFARWAEARDALTRLDRESGEAAAAVEAAARAVARTQVEQITAEQALKPLREEETIASAVLHRLALEKDRLDHQAETAAAEIARCEAEIARVDADAARETQIVDDSGRALARLSAEIAEVETEIASAPERGPELEARAKSAEIVRAEVQDKVTALASRVAGEEAQRHAQEQRVEEARSRLSRTARALEQARSERAALGPAGDDKLAQARVRLAVTETALKEARQALEAAETRQAAAVAAEAAARTTARTLDDALRRLKSEAEGLRRLTDPPKGRAYPPALDEVAPEAGYEAALAAALGDDLNAALDSAAPSYWGGGQAPLPVWPEGARSLAPLIRAPLALATRLSYTALVERKDGPRLQALLQPGQRLVSREGDLWRWDGFVSRAEAPRPAAVRLEQKTRLLAVATEIQDKTPALEAANAAHQAAAAELAAATQALSPARQAPREAEKRVSEARFTAETLDRDGARREARAGALDDTIARFEAEHAEAEAALAKVTSETPLLSGIDALAAELAAARADAVGANADAVAARSAADLEARERGGRQTRLESLQRDHADWTTRAEAAQRRQASLAAAREKAMHALAAARTTPQALETGRAKLLDELAAAEARKARSADALHQGETRRSSAERELRAAEARGAEAREARGVLTGHLDGARERYSELAAQLRQSAHMEPEALGKKLAEEAVAIPSDVAGVEAHLENLTRQRDQIGAVNLRAEEDAVEHAARLNTLKSEHADLSGALTKLRQGVDELNSEGRERLLAAFDVINGHFRALFTALFGGGEAELRLVESDDPLEAGLEIYACPPGKRLAAMSLMSGGEQALTATALIFGVFLANPAPICVLDEVDAPLDDANVERFCNLLAEMCSRAPTRFVAITHNPLTMSRMNRLFGVTMPERGISQLVSVDLMQAETLAAE